MIYTEQKSIVIKYMQKPWNCVYHNQNMICIWTGYQS